MFEACEGGKYENAEEGGEDVEEDGGEDGGAEGGEEGGEDGDHGDEAYYVQDNGDFEEEEPEIVELNTPAEKTAQAEEENAEVQSENDGIRNANAEVVVEIEPRADVTDGVEQISSEVQNNDIVIPPEVLASAPFHLETEASSDVPGSPIDQIPLGLIS